MSEEIKRAPKRVPKKKVCQFCVDKVNDIDYKIITADKDGATLISANHLKKYVTDKGKMIPRRMTGVCSKHQRVLAQAIKRARVMGLLPYKAD